MTPSLGVSMYPTDGTDFDTLMRNADLAMYTAKDMGKNQVQVFDPSRDARVQQRRATLLRIEQAAGLLQRGLGLSAALEQGQGMALLGQCPGLLGGHLQLGKARHRPVVQRQRLGQEFADARGRLKIFPGDRIHHSRGHARTAALFAVHQSELHAAFPELPREASPREALADDDPRRVHCGISASFGSAHAGSWPLA